MNFGQIETEPQTQQAKTTNQAQNLEITLESESEFEEKKDSDRPDIDVRIDKSPFQAHVGLDRQTSLHAFVPKKDP